MLWSTYSGDWRPWSSVMQVHILAKTGIWKKCKIERRSMGCSKADLPKSNFGNSTKVPNCCIPILHKSKWNIFHSSLCKWFLKHTFGTSANFFTQSNVLKTSFMWFQFSVASQNSSCLLCLGKSLGPDSQRLLAHKNLCESDLRCVS